MSHSPLLAPESLLANPEGFILLDCRPDVIAFATGHLMGARHADLNAVLSTARAPGFDPAGGGRHPLPDAEAFCEQLGAWGIAPESPVVVYDDASGGNAAARCWWMLRALGHGPVALLDGGLQAAVADGFSLTSEAAGQVAQAVYPPRPWESPTVDLETVSARCGDSEWKLIDVRSPERWRGDSEPFDPIPGRIPGSLNLPYTQNLQPDGRFKSPEALRAQFLNALGGTSPEKLTVHCGSGVTACHTLLAMEVAGLPGASLYVGSYSEWCRRGMPLGKGDSGH